MNKKLLLLISLIVISSILFDIKLNHSIYINIDAIGYGVYSDVANHTRVLDIILDAWNLTISRRDYLLCVVYHIAYNITRNITVSNFTWIYIQHAYIIIMLHGSTIAKYNLLSTNHLVIIV